MFVDRKGAIEHLGKQTGVDQTPGRLAFTATVFRLLFPPLVVDLSGDTRIGDPTAFFFGFLVGNQQPVVIVKSDGAVFDFKQDLFADHLRGHLVTAGVIGDGTVLVDLTVLLDGGVVVTGRAWAQTDQLLLPAHIHHLSVSAVLPTVRRFGHLPFAFLILVSVNGIAGLPAFWGNQFLFGGKMLKNYPRYPWMSIGFTGLY